MTDFNRIRYRAVIEFFTLENILPQQVHNRMTVEYGEDAPSYATVPVSKFKETSPGLKIFEQEGAQVCDRQVVDRTVRTAVFYTHLQKLLH